MQNITSGLCFNIKIKNRRKIMKQRKKDSKKLAFLMLAGILAFSLLVVTVNSSLGSTKGSRGVYSRRKRHDQHQCERTG